MTPSLLDKFMGLFWSVSKLELKQNNYLNDHRKKILFLVRQLRATKRDLKSRARSFQSNKQTKTGV